MINEISSSDVLKQILLNQREILGALSSLLYPMCKGSQFDKNGETKSNISLIHRYHETEKLLGLNWNEEVESQYNNIKNGE